MIPASGLRGPPAPDAVRAWQLALFGALALAGVAWLARAYADGEFASSFGWRRGESAALVRLVLVAAGAALAVAWIRPALLPLAGSLGLAAMAVVAFGPAAFAAVLLLATAAALTGARILRAFGAAEGDVALSLAAGAVAIAAAIGATARLAIHWPWVHALALAGLACAFRSEARPLAGALRAFGTDRDPDRVRALALALLGAVLAVHVVVAARPEIGADALAMHMQVAVRMAHDHWMTRDVTRHVWAVMPLSADWLYAAGYLLAGEPAAKAVNLGAFVLVVVFVLRLARTDVARDGASSIALAALFASTPLAFVETSSLFVENVWTALLLGATLAAERAIRANRAPLAVASLWLAAGSLQVKVIGAPWVLLLGLALAWRWRARWRQLDRRAWLGLAAAALVAAWPYAEAWVRTGNPVFPFMNATFRSPLFETATSFNNALYNAGVHWRTWYDMVVASARHVEGSNGAAGLHWLVLFPAVLVLMRAADARRVAPLLALAVVFFVATWQQQSYLRYVYPSLALLTALAARVRAVEASPRLVLAAVVPLAAANLALMPSGVWWNASLCLRCAVDTRVRNDYRDRYGEQRRIVDWLQANAPDARVGWLRQHVTGPAGYAGPIWLAGWHDYPTFSVLRSATSAEEIDAYARSRGTDLFVLPAQPGTTPFERATADFRERFTTPILTSGGTVLARWAETPDRVLLRLPEGLAGAVHDDRVRREGERVVLAPDALLWFEARDARVLSYRLVPACPVGFGSAVALVSWIDHRDSVLKTDAIEVACSSDGRESDAVSFAPRGAVRGRFTLLATRTGPFALRSLVVSNR